ncbi:MAG TPA: hypothetical protein VL625_03045 [Patescibacteria group bacterium]|nr:hypothetical protein [Patescibacteria group bacterium]
MGVVTKGTAIIIDKNTGETFEIQSDELDWQPENAAMPGTEPGQRHIAQIDHPVLGTLIWSIWEYPGTSENIRETDPNGHSLEQDFEYWFESREDMGKPSEAQDNTPLMNPTEKPAKVRTKSKAKRKSKVKSKTKARTRPKAKAKPKAAKKSKPVRKTRPKKPARKIAKKARKSAPKKRSKK